MIRDKYNEIKAKYPDALLLFRVGDYYKLYNTDAAKLLKLVPSLIRTWECNVDDEGDEIYTATFPNYKLSAYITKIIRAGYRVAICDDITK